MPSSIYFLISLAEENFFFSAKNFFFFFHINEWVPAVKQALPNSKRIGLDWNIYLTELQSIVLYYNNNKQPQLQDPWNEPLALVWCFSGGAADGEGDGPPPALLYLGLLLRASFRGSDPWP